MGSAVAADSIPNVDSWAAISDRTCHEVWRTVQDAYYDPKFGGVDWVATYHRYRARLPAVKDNEQLRELLREMLGELNQSHFAILPRNAAVFSPTERVRLGTVGFDVGWVENAIVVQRVREGSPAEKIGLKAGEIVVEINGTNLEYIAAAVEAAGLTGCRRTSYLISMVSDGLHASVGTELDLLVRDRKGDERKLALTYVAHEGPWIEPMGNFPSQPVECDARRGADGIAYLRLNVFAPLVMKHVRGLLRQLRAGDGLIIDLRGNPGGLMAMAPGISGWLTDREFSLGVMQMREGRMDLGVFPQTGAFLGPLAILIDARSASTSEVLAAGLKEAGRARIFGETSAGAALPSIFKVLPTGDLFQYVIADLRTPRGVLVEGNGVIPDEVVAPMRSDLFAGNDPVLDRARDWIDAVRKPEAKQ
jgi:carboxyl-terminal processing protease